MSRPNTYEQKLLSRAHDVLASYSSSFEEQMLVVECCASKNGRFDICNYWRMLGISVPKLKFSRINTIAEILLEAINQSGIPVPLAISSLSRKPIPVSEQKKEGAFYTDYRLAQYVASCCQDLLNIDSSVADIAAGTGILIASVASEYKKKFPDSFDRWIAHCLFAFDLSVDALRGGMAAIASLTSSIDAIGLMWNNWHSLDSLITEEFTEKSFDIIVGNPPWGKIKLTRHQFSLENGVEHTYGADYKGLDVDSYGVEKKKRGDYASILKEKYSLLGSSETDYYIAFIERALGLLAPAGRLVYIVPAGVIRSQGTFAIRERIFYHYSNVLLSLFDNKESYFNIDSRFKFLIMTLDNSGLHDADIELKNYKESGKSLQKGTSVRIELDALSKCRKDLTIPEVSSKEELELFFRISENSQDISKWEISVCREVDMTNDKPHFETAVAKDSIPVIEGRMVQPYRVGAKRYKSGSGRKAIWEPCEQGLFPQYYIAKEKLSPEVQERIRRIRVGYCDIAGQTNERSMMAAVIPKDTVCGNKVPTILFSGKNAEDYLYFWLGVANSIVFDWLLRRVLTTTVNYFVLWSIPFPNIRIDDSVAIQIIKYARALSEMGADYYASDTMGNYRAQIDVLVAKAYGLRYEDIKLILTDFPLLDRGQFSIGGKDSVTKALIMSTAENEYGRKENNNRVLSNQLFGIGAKPFILSEMKQLSNMPKVLIVVYKEIIAGDLAKFTATSNITKSGGGARDLRFSPSDRFLPIFQRIFPETKVEKSKEGPKVFNFGKFSWESGVSTDVKIGAPTTSRPTEMRICSIDKSFPSEYYPTDATDCILLFIYDSEHRVHPFFTSSVSLKEDAWNPEIRRRILQGLAAQRAAGQAAMGYLDFENNDYYTNGKIRSDY